MTDPYSSAEELLERHIRDMGEELGRVYNELTNEVSRLHVKYDLWRQLYARSRKRVDLLNRTAGHFFGVLQRALIDDVLLHLARLTDRESVAGRATLTIRRLSSVVPDTLRLDVGTLVVAATTACDPVRPWRNRRLAHMDLESAIANVVVSGITNTQIEAALTSLRALLNKIEVHFWNTPTAYEMIITPPGDADSLVFYLMKGIRAEERRHQRLLEGKPLPEDLEQEDLP
jgi:hypothetical protein